MGRDRLRELSRKKIKKEVSKMARKSTVILLVVGLCLMGLTPVLAQQTYPTLDEYEKLTGKRIEKFNEVPILKVKVAAGELPSVEERLPEEPMVVEPKDEIGQHGGELRVQGGSGRWGFTRNIRIQGMLNSTPDLKRRFPVVPKGLEWSKDLKTLTVYLRKGMKWSDGAPFTADDFLFTYEDVDLNKMISPVTPKNWRSVEKGGKGGRVEKMDDYTVRYIFAVPYPIFEPSVPSPKHYLKKYHIKYNPKANELAKKEGYSEWWMCFQGYNAPEMDEGFPSVDAWVITKTTSTERIYERNPYYWKVDTAGNQLPYIDHYTRMIIENPEVVAIKAIAGEFSVIGGRLQNYPLYKENEGKGNYHVTLWKGGIAAEVFFSFNLTHKDPVLRKIFRDIRFRQAMSLAVNREEINDIFFFGKAVPRQATVLPTASFYEDWMGKYYAEYDPERANNLLDEMGLKWDKNHQYRLMSDGKPLTIDLTYCEMTAEIPTGKVCQLTREYWEKVGVKTTTKELQREFYATRGRANERTVGVWHFDRATEFRMHMTPIRFQPPFDSGGREAASGIPWWNWYNTDGKTGEEPPDEVKKLFKLVEKWQTVPKGTDEYIKLAKEIVTINLKNLFAIGTVGMKPSPVITKNSLRNTPKIGLWAVDYASYKPYQGDQWFFEK